MRLIAFFIKDKPEPVFCIGPQEMRIKQQHREGNFEYTAWMAIPFNAE
jgi:hypothetical protein